MHYWVWRVSILSATKNISVNLKNYIGMIVFTYNIGKALYAKQVLKEKEKE